MFISLYKYMRAYAVTCDDIAGNELKDSTVPVDSKISPSKYLILKG